MPGYRTSTKLLYIHICIGAHRVRQGNSRLPLLLHVMVELSYSLKVSRKSKRWHSWQAFRISETYVLRYQAYIKARNTGYTHDLAKRATVPSYISEDISHFRIVDSVQLPNQYFSSSSIQCTTTTYLGFAGPTAVGAHRTAKFRSRASFRTMVAAHVTRTIHPDHAQKGARFEISTCQYY